MEIFISIDGVLRNTIQKFDYHYNDAYLDSELEEGNTFVYNIEGNVQNDNLLNYYKFQSKEEFDYFTFIEYPIEIFGHAGLSYSTTFTDLHKVMFDNPQHTYTLIGLDELGKAKPGTLFFLSKNGFLGNNIKFITTNDIEKNWELCDVWITDNKTILDTKKENKVGIKFNTTYNQYFTNQLEISKLTEIETICPNFITQEKATTLISNQSQKNVEQEIQ
jgi:hypothetical protein